MEVAMSAALAPFDSSGLEDRQPTAPTEHFDPHDFDEQTACI